MTNAFTDTQQIDESWETPTMLDAVLEEVSAILEDDFSIGCGDFVEQNSWAEELAIQGLLMGEKTPEEVAQQIAEEWEPTDDEMMSAFGTKWHDGM